jgi:hypothetical protein
MMKSILLVVMLLASTAANAQSIDEYCRAKYPPGELRTTCQLERYQALKDGQKQTRPNPICRGASFDHLSLGGKADCLFPNDADKRAEWIAQMEFNAALKAQAPKHCFRYSPTQPCIWE